MAVYNVSFAIETNDDPEDWYWPAILESIDADGDRVIFSTLSIQEVIV